MPQNWQTKLGFSNSGTVRGSDDATVGAEWLYGAELDFQEAQPSIHMPTEQQAKALLERYVKPCSGL